MMLITPTKNFLINNVNFGEKSFICFNKFNEKDQITSIFQEFRPN